MTNTMKDIRIDSHQQEGGLNWARAGMLDAADALREVLRCMAALLRVTRGQGSVADFERLGIKPDADPVDAVSNYAWPLDVQASDSRVLLLLGAGDPYIELDVLRSESHIDEVILRRHWLSTRERAWTTDGRALEIVADFLDLIGRQADSRAATVTRPT